MNEAIKTLRHKEYNPCGDLTGYERAFCDEATKNYFKLPYVEVMRAISIQAISKFEHETNFRNVSALENWSSYNLNEVEQRANLNFDTFTPLQAGICKYFVHLLYENRYNIHYNCLVNYCRDFDEQKFAIGLTSKQLEQKINSIAQNADYFSTVNALTDELLNFIEGSQSDGVIEGTVEFLRSILT